MCVKFHPECAMYGTYFVRLSSEKSHRAGIAVQPSPTEDPKTLNNYDKFPPHRPPPSPPPNPPQATRVVPQFSSQNPGHRPHAHPSTPAARQEDFHPHQVSRAATPTPPNDVERGVLKITLRNANLQITLAQKRAVRAEEEVRWIREAPLRTQQEIEDIRAENQGLTQLLKAKVDEAASVRASLASSDQNLSQARQDAEDLRATRLPSAAFQSELDATKRRIDTLNTYWSEKPSEARRRKAESRGNTTRDRGFE